MSSDNNPHHVPQENDKKSPIKKMADHTPDNRMDREVFIRVDPKGRHLTFSDNLPAFFHFKKSPFSGKTLTEAGYLGDDSRSVETALSQTIQSGIPFFEERQLSLNGKLLPAEISIFPEFDDEHKVTAATVIIRDISIQEKIKQKYLENKQHFDLIAESSDYGIWEWLPEENTTFFSKKWKLMLGYLPGEIPNLLSSWMDNLHPEDLHRIKFELDNFMKDTSLIFESEFRMRHKNGTYLWIKCRAAAIRNQSNQVVRLLGTNRDYTTDKKNQEALQIRQQSILQSPLPIVITNTDGFIEFCNPAFSKTTGYSAEEAIGQKTNILKSGYHPKSFYKMIWNTITSGNEWRGEFRNKTKKGTLYWELASISALRNEWGEITHYVKIAGNISTIKKMEVDLQKAKRQAENAIQYKNIFLSDVSHEIRTSLNGIIGFTELLKTNTLNNEQYSRYLNIIVDSSYALLGFIDNFVALSKIEANELKIKKEACSLSEIIKETDELFQTMKLVKNKGHLDIRSRVPKIKHHDYIFTDPGRLKQVLKLLLSNALKFTEAGHIEFGYQILSNQKLQFYVEDTGFGISPEKQNSIFKRKLQPTNENKQKPEGAGIGLAICQGLVTLLGGSIGVKSQVSKGSLFYFTLPYDKIKNPEITHPQPAKSNINFNERTILIAEDVVYNFEYLKEIITPTGATVLWAKDGIDAINLYRKNKVDLILMDIQLPELDGYEAIKTIRETDKQTPIIAQTAYAMSDDKIRCMNAGSNEVLVKPLRIEQVIETLTKYLKE